MPSLKGSDWLRILFYFTPPVLFSVLCSSAVVVVRVGVLMLQLGPGIHLVICRNSLQEDQDLRDRF